MVGIVAVIVGLSLVVCIQGVPGFVIARRSGNQNPGVAFVPLFGVWIVLLETLRRSGWFALLTFIPYLGTLVLLVWVAFDLPVKQGRSRWWTVALGIPGPNLIAYWFYAFTLPQQDSPRLQPAIA